MMRTISILFIAMLGAATNACSPYSPTLPSEPFLCGTDDPKCPDGYNCTDGGGGTMVCVVANGTVTDGGADASNCADDSQLEPNNDVSHAFQTPLDNPKKTLTFAGLAICPAGDKDTYAITISTPLENVEVIVMYDAGGAALQGSILNSGGSPIGNASPMGTNTVRAYTPNLPVGTYYAQVYGPASGTSVTNNYKLTINITGP